METTERLHFDFSLSCIGEGNGNPLQCSHLENPRDSGAWWAAIYGVAQSWTRLKRLSSSSSNISRAIKKWQDYTELYKKDLDDLDYHDGVITYLEPDILECEVERALGSITVNKASGGDRIPAKLFQILKDGAVKALTQYASKFGKLRSGHRTGKGQFLFQSQRKAMPKNAQTTTQLHSSHMLVK